MTQNKSQATNVNDSKRFWVEYGFTCSDGASADNFGWITMPSKTKVLKEILSWLEEGEELKWYCILTEEEFQDDQHCMFNGIFGKYVVEL